VDEKTELGEDGAFFFQSTVAGMIQEKEIENKETAGVEV
jgi:hypothetical protein